MKWIENSFRSRVPSKKIWKIWTSQHPSLKKKQQESNYLYQNDKKKIKFEFANVVPEQEFTTIWKAAPFIKLHFKYLVEDNKRGSIITFAACFRGFYAPILQFFLKKSLKTKVDESLKAFVDQVEFHP